MKLKLDVMLTQQQARLTLARPSHAYTRDLCWVWSTMLSAAKSCTRPLGFVVIDFWELIHWLGEEAVPPEINIYSYPFIPLRSC